MELRENYELQNGKYRIINKIGRGGFGITYRAEWATEVTGPMGKMKTAITVAIKEFFFEEYCTRESGAALVTITSATGRDLFDKFKNKLKKEAQLLSKLQHPNIVRVLDVFEENNTAYIVMAFVDGESLKDKLKREGKLDEQTTLKYAAQVCDALAEIHKRKILHLDIKPGNILIDKNDNVLLIDFGISKQYDDQHQETSTTPVGISKGFAPPEQYSGLQTFTPAADIYALGATIYNMLTGVIPVESILQINAPSKPVKDFAPDVSPFVDSAVLKAMSIRHIDRQQTVEEFRRSLTEQPAAVENLKDEPVKTAPAPAPAPEPKPAAPSKDPDDSTRIDEPVTTEGGTKLPPAPPSEIKKPRKPKKWMIVLGIILGIPMIAFTLFGFGLLIYSLFADIDYSESHNDIELIDSHNVADTLYTELETSVSTQPTVSNEETLRQQQDEQARLARAEEQRKADLKTALANAERAFANKQYSQALTHYKKAKTLSPGDDTGYYRFLNKAKELALVLGEYDGNVKAMLLNARELKNTSEVNTLISQCR